MGESIFEFVMLPSFNTAGNVFWQREAEFICLPPPDCGFVCCLSYATQKGASIVLRSVEGRTSPYVDYKENSQKVTEGKENRTGTKK